MLSPNGSQTCPARCPPHDATCASIELMSGGTGVKRTSASSSGRRRPGEAFEQAVRSGGQQHREHHVRADLDVRRPPPRAAGAASGAGSAASGDSPRRGCSTATCRRARSRAAHRPAAARVPAHARRRRRPRGARARRARRPHRTSASGSASAVASMRATARPRSRAISIASALRSMPSTFPNLRSASEVAPVPAPTSRMRFSVPVSAWRSSTSMMLRRARCHQYQSS